MLHGAKVASRCLCVEPRWQVEMLYGALCGAKVASRCRMEHCVEPRWQLDV